MGISADAAVDVTRSVESLIKEAYETGLSEGSQKAEEVWTFISNTVTPNTPERAWDTDTDKSIGYGNVWEKFDTYAEARAAFEAWKKRGQWEPIAGDVVRLRDSTIVGVITGFINPLGNYQLWANTGKGYNFSLDELEPTGRHVDLSNIFKVLEEVEHE